ncbi:galectin-12 isoform X4 [Equus przewalskii]|uniref:Galectin n=2 Tax=Equus TaxID=9789 RepID=A0A3Q2I7M0_HORSE
MSSGEKLDPLPDTFILQPPVFHPVVPYVTTIFGGLRAGKMVMLQGVVPRNAHRFQVDFQCGCTLYPRPDIAIHFNPRFHTTKPHVICNTLHHGHWQVEARWPNVALQRGDSFLILFLFENEQMKVSVNGQHFLHYRYRLPLSRVDTLGIFGDILVKAVGFLNINPFVEGGSEYPVGHFHTESAGQGRPCSCDTQGFLRRQDSGLDLALGTEDADLGPLPLLPPAILRGAAPVPGGRAEAGAQWTGHRDHQPGPANPGAAAGAPDQWQRAALLCPPLRRDPEGLTREEEGQPMPGATQYGLPLLLSLDCPPVTTMSRLARSVAMSL